MFIISSFFRIGIKKDKIEMAVKNPYDGASFYLGFYVTLIPLILFMISYTFLVKEKAIISAILGIIGDFYLLYELLSFPSMPVKLLPAYYFLFVLWLLWLISATMLFIVKQPTTTVPIT